MSRLAATQQNPCEAGFEFRSIFIGSFGLRSGWRFILFLLLFAVFAAGAAATRHLTGEWRVGLSEAWSLTSVLLALAVMSRIERKPLRHFGLESVNARRNFSIGVASGLISLSLLIGVLALSRAYHLTISTRPASEVFLWAGISLLFFLIVGVFEELLTRGYALFALSQGIGFWPAAIVMSLIFGAVHLGNRGEDYIGIVAAVLIGVVLAWSLRRSGSLWWAIGYHFAWDWAETFFYGLPDSGAPSPHYLFTGAASGPAWLSGATVGPEGSVLILPVILVLALVVKFALPAVRVEGLDRLGTSEALSSTPVQD